jgi:regulator of sirC expression with transglutaminase-like and TPR domain
VDGTDWALHVTNWTRRSVELDARIRDLHERNAQLSVGFGPPDLEERRATGSTPDHVAKARAAAKMATLRALEALQRTATMRLHAADAHDRAAVLHEMLADANSGDVQEHRDRATTHRRLAGEDRAAADVIFRSQHVQPPEPGPS